MKNYAASVQAQLKNMARAEGKNFQLLLIRYFQERILFRLSQSQYANRFCLKGGALVYALEQEKSRPTMDLDFLGVNVSRDPEGLIPLYEEILSMKYEPDGVTFDTSSISISEIIKEGNYNGTRIKIIAFLGKIRQNMQIDIGFGDTVTPKPIHMKYPTLLAMDEPEVLAYSVETIIAEKFEAMIDLAEMNSRMKDFYDLYRLLQPGKYDASVLRQAISNTFHTRGTMTPKEHVLFQEAFSLNEKRISQWNTFLKKSKLENISFGAVHLQITEVLKPIYERL